MSNKNLSNSKIATELVHCGELEDEDFSPAITPIYRSTTYRLNEDLYALVKKYAKTEDPNAKITDEELRDFRYKVFYTRDSNPNVLVLQKKLALIEGCDDAVATSSGMGAITSTLLSLIKGKKYIVSTPHLYGVAFSFVYNELKDMFGIDVIELDDFIAGKISKEIKANEISAIYLETLTNPFLLMPPLDEIKKIRDDLCPEVPIVVDNTFLTPVNFKPFDLLDPKKDIVIHSATKYLGGHSDVIAGFACGSISKVNPIWEKMSLYGCCLDGETAYHLEKGLKTLHLRMEKHNQNAYQVVKYLSEVSGKYNLKIFHPLNGEYKIPEYAKPLLENKRLGGMVTFSINGKKEEDGVKFMNLVDRMGVIKHATSLGGVESLICMPYNTSQPTYKQQEAIGLKKHPCLLRLSVGIEDAEDIIDSLDSAFKEIL